MENNKILIGIQFMEKGITDNADSVNYELYVIRDITLSQLFEGIQYGLKRAINTIPREADIYKKCEKIFLFCKEKTSSGYDGRQYYTNILISAYDNTTANKIVSVGDKDNLYEDIKDRPICDIGFITSTKLIFFAEEYAFAGEEKKLSFLDTKYVIDAFNPKVSTNPVFPEYNISSRELYAFDKTAIEIIAPTEPPHKENRGLVSMLLPSILSIGILMIVRMIFLSGSTGISMIALSIAMGISAIAVTVYNYLRDKKEFAKKLSNWRKQYEDYINSVIEEIVSRQKKDIRKLDELYPDIVSLLEQNEKGIYSLKDSMYSRTSRDEDFLSFRLGVSNNVDTMFPIKGDNKDVVFSEASFYLDRDGGGKDKFSIVLQNEMKEDGRKYTNLCKTPHTISQKYRYLDNAPLLYSLKNKGVLGIVDTSTGLGVPNFNLIVSRMIFELCYYHSPEMLQFIMLFDSSTDIKEIERSIVQYKFMPHFRGLFQDRSQFVFDDENANSVMSRLYSIVSSRKHNNNDASLLPHIVVVVFDEHKLKEHAFAEYLPKPPENEQEYINDIGLTFVYVTKYKELLPAYCNDIIRVNYDDEIMTLTPHNNISETKQFKITDKKIVGFDNAAIRQYILKVVKAYRFLSSIHYSQIAQNGKVPSGVSIFDLFFGVEDGNEKAKLESMIIDNWNAADEQHRNSITDSLAIPIGKTETGLEYLDLHEKYDGPHMLVAGTTGSGKTETIISYLLGLCVKFRPDELNLLLVDMKGGGFTKRLGNLPHVVGKVTDVDGDENGTSEEYMLGRFLFAIKAEIKRRKMLLNELQVDSVDSYIEASKNIDSYIKSKNISDSKAEKIRMLAKKKKLTHLVLVIDEFTELKRFTSENSDIDFMGEITTIARIGRSLGFHIILISQNIEGAITEDIRVNSRARLCLKVATKQASKDMIGSDLAALPAMPGNGRAYLLVGNGSKFDYFQSAYSGSYAVGTKIPVEITMASKVGNYYSFYNSNRDNIEQIEKKEKLKKDGVLKTQLDVVSDVICKVYKKYKDQINTPKVIFRDPLPTSIVLDNDIIRDTKKMTEVNYTRREEHGISNGYV